MENTKKCSSKGHKKDAICFCLECDKYMCNQCLNFHSDLLENHHKYDLKNNELQNLTSCFCQEQNHKMELIYFCKNHNQLCCAACIAKLKGKGNGQHSNCNICFITEIKDKKKSNLKKNIKILEDYSKNIEQSLNELKKIYEKINTDKEDLKKEVSKVFTNIRYSLNHREDELILEIENKFDNLFFKEDLIKQGEKLPNKIKTSLEKGKAIDNDNYKIDKLSIFVNDCINIENNINNIKLIKDNIEKNKNKEIIINFSPKEEKEINKFMDKIKLFGKINQNIIEHNKKENQQFENQINYNFQKEEINQKDKEEIEQEEIDEENQNEEINQIDQEKMVQEEIDEKNENYYDYQNEENNININDEH